MSTNVNTIAEKLGRVKTAAYNINQSIILKGQIPSGGIESYPAAIDAISGGGSSERTNWDVVFVDYDGTILDRYELAEGGTITFPQAPVHADKGIVFKKWNSAGNTATVANYGLPEGVTDLQKRIIIGAIYTPAEKQAEEKVYPSSTSMKIDIYAMSYNQLNIRIASTVADGTQIDWGDGTTTASTSTSATTYSHTYTTAGIYNIVISCQGDCKFSFEGQSQGSSSITGSANQKVSDLIVGTNCNKIGNYAMTYRHGFTSIDLPPSVTSIGNYAFVNSYALESINIPDSVTSIGSYAFQNCFSLKSVNIPDSLTSIGSSAFNNCYSLESVSFPNTLTSIGSNAFYGCYSLNYINIPDSVTSIANSAFYNCYSLKAAIIPSETTSIGSSSFNSCPSLSIISYNGKKGAFCDNDHQRLVSSLVNYYWGVPSLNGTDIFGIKTRITKSVKYTYDINYVSMPDDATSISNNSFYNCFSLESIDIPDTVTSIGGESFRTCSRLRNINIPDAVTSIGTSAFQNCYSLDSVSLSDDLTSIGSSAFNNCYSLESIDIPEGVTSIANNTFNGCYSLKSVNLSEDLTSIANNAFQNCYSLKSIDIPDGVTSIGTSIFQQCYSLNSVSIPDTVTTLSSALFASCYALKSIDIPDTVTHIANSFNSCYSLREIKIPNSVSSFSASNFQNCNALRVINFGNTRSNVFSQNNINTNIKGESLRYIVVPDALYDSWKASWTNFTEFIIKYTDYQNLTNNA